jgi:3-hydroxyisobutyrate dehydrogenase
METRKLAFLGLGVMGFPMAGHLARAGHSVTVYNRTAARAEKWLASTKSPQKCASAPTPAAAAAGASMVMMCVGNDDDVRAVALGPDGAVAAMQRGSILVDHTTFIERRRPAASAFSMRRSPAGRRARRTAS